MAFVNLQHLLLVVSLGTIKCSLLIPQYTVLTGSSERCMTECSYYSSGDYYYCYVDGDRNWDYCSPNQDNRPLIKKAFTLKNGPCKSACSWSSWYSAYTCDNYWGTTDDYCDTKLWEYVKSYTYKGKECIGTCEKHGRSYYWCYDEDKNDDYCSPYNLEELEQYIRDEIKKVREYFEYNKGTCWSHDRSRRPRQSNRFPPVFTSVDSNIPGNLMAYAATLAALGSVGRLISEWRPAETIYRFSFLNPSTPNGPVLPLLIAAHITEQTLNNTVRRGDVNSISNDAVINIDRMGRHTDRVDNNNDENGHLIAYENGGPNEVYNFAPQPRSLNRGIVSGVQYVRQSDWRRSEDSVHNWVSARNGWVDETVVVIYDDYQRNPRPVGFGQHLVYYYSNNTVRFECDDYYSNDPNAPPHLQDRLP